jgi:uncharacterized protein YbjT (DUF2867 family)
MNADISVLAASGKSGRRVVAALRAAGHPVRAASRSAEVRFDWHDPSTWPAVTDGVGALYLVAPEDPAPLRPFVDLVQDAGVKRVVLLSGRGAQGWGDRYGHAMVAAEDVVRGSDLSWTILQPNNFMQNFTEDVWHAPLLAGRLALPTAGVPEPFIDLDDLAAVAARLLTSDEYGGRTFELSGPAALTFGDAVAVIATAAGRQIRYDELTPDAYVDELRATGVEEYWVTELSSMFEVLRNGANAAPAPGVEQVLGRPPRSLADWVADIAPTGVWAG